MEQLLSIIVPTKDRYPTLIPVLRAICKFVPDPRLQLVVEDNSSAEAPEELMTLIASDSRIAYARFEGRRSIVDNTVAALERATGEYLTFIGDDDFVSPAIMRAVEVLRDSGLPCLIYPQARYWWSSVHFLKPTRFHRPQALWLPRNLDWNLRTLSSARSLDVVLRGGGTTYADLPRFYHGIVSRSALESIRRSTGHYVPGSSPDMAFSIALAMEFDRYAHVAHPVTVFGASKGSGGGRTAQRTHHGRLEDQKHLPPGIQERWDPRVPRIWSELCIYPQTIYEVMGAYGRSDRKVSYAAFYAALIVNEPHLSRWAWPLAVRFGLEHPRHAAALAAQVARKLAGRTKRALQSRVAIPDFELHLCPTIEDAMHLVAQRAGDSSAAPLRHGSEQARHG